MIQKEKEELEKKKKLKEEQEKKKRDILKQEATEEVKKFLNNFLKVLDKRIYDKYYYESDE